MDCVQRHLSRSFCFIHWLLVVYFFYVMFKCTPESFVVIYNVNKNSSVDAMLLTMNYSIEL